MFEFKYNSSPQVVLDQIETSDYGRRYFASERHVVAIGLNFVSDRSEEPSRIEYRTRVRTLSDPEPFRT